MRKYIGKNEFKILNSLWEKSPLLVSEIVEMDKSLKTEREGSCQKVQTSSEIGRLFDG